MPAGEPRPSHPGRLFDRARERLERHATIWAQRPLTRDIYRGYHERILAARSGAPGVDVEVGAGHGSFAEFHRGVVSCDLVACPWLDCAADAMALPFADDCVSNIIMLDVLHHVACPARFFEQAERVLAPGGRVILIEPYASPVSSIAWRFLCDEPFDGSVTPLIDGLGAEAGDADDPWGANTAAPTLLFWRDLDLFHSRSPRSSRSHA